MKEISLLLDLCTSLYQDSSYNLLTTKTTKNNPLGFSLSTLREQSSLNDFQPLASNNPGQQDATKQVEQENNPFLSTSLVSNNLGQQAIYKPNLEII
jgi:hypothetical protein